MADVEDRETSFFDRRHGDVVIDALRRQRQSDGALCDVTLNVRGRVIAAHAAVLAAVSPYFAEFFGTDLPRAYSQRCPQVIDIVVDGVDATGTSVLADAVEAVVEFIYSGYLRVNQLILARVAEIAGIMRLESAIHFCEEISSGKLYSNQLLIKDGKLIEKADAKLSTIDDSIAKDSNPVSMTAEVPKVMLSASQARVVRPPGLISVSTQVYPALLDIAATKLNEDKQQNTKLVGPGLRNLENFRGERCKLQKLGSGNGPNSECNSTGIKGRCRQPARARRKPVKLADAAETCRKNKSCLSSEIKSLATKGSAKDVENMTNKSNVAETVTFHNDSLNERGETHTDPRLSSIDLDLGGKFQCSICQFSTNNVRKISEHNREHQRANNICYYCDRRFGSSTELSVHVDADHADSKTDKTPFVCCSCPARFRTRTQLVAHLPKHSSTRPYICAKCGASFKWRNTLYDHAATHTSRKEHLCDICGYATAHRGQLRSHRLVHTGGTMRCSWKDCDFRATRMQNLKYHLLTHTQEKPHQCEICGQSFSLAKNLKRHMMSHVNTATKHNCSRCTFSTLRYDKLKEHLHKQHKVGSAPERRVRITDLVNLDLAKTLEGSVTQPAPQSTQQQSLDSRNSEVILQPDSTITDLNLAGGNPCTEKQQAVIDSSSVIVVEPVDFLLGNIQGPLSVLTTVSSENHVKPGDVTMLLTAELVREQLGSSF